MVSVLGIDARGRAPFWTARLTDGEVEHVAAVESLDVALQTPGVEAIALDVALGHEDPEGHGSGLRACDRAARDVLGSAAERMFVLPPPAVFEADTYHDALETCRTHGWPKLEPPLWFARERLAALAQAAGEDERLLEVHPEISFAHMNGLRGEIEPAEGYGDSWAALNERLELLHEAGLHPEGHLEETEDPDPRAALDATAAAWSAHRAARGEAACLPEDPPRDPRTGREVVLYA